VISVLYRKPPLAPAFMSRALKPSPPFRFDAGVPPICVRWEGLRFSPRDLAAFAASTGLEAADGISVLYPHVAGFRLQMALLTLPAYPLPIWNALQIRNHLIRHRALDPGGVYALEARTAVCRVLEKGVEIDVVTRLTRGEACDWECTVTYFYRGRFKGERSEGTPPAAPDLTAAQPADRFRVPSGGRWTFGRLTGDYNGIHIWNPYARRFGFAAAFAHPQRVAAMCLARLQRLAHIGSPTSDAQSLDLWLKGPVFYGATAEIRADAGEGAVNFGVSLEGDGRVAIAGCWRGA
jgi:acyl dehydratase